MRNNLPLDQLLWIILKISANADKVVFPIPQRERDNNLKLRILVINIR
jgi:hypothetical protein